MLEVPHPRLQAAPLRLNVCPFCCHAARMKCASAAQPPPLHPLGRQLRLQLVQPCVEPAELVDLLLVLQLHVHRGHLWRGRLGARGAGQTRARGGSRPNGTVGARAAALQGRRCSAQQCNWRVALPPSPHHAAAPRCLLERSTASVCPRRGSRSRSATAATDAQRGLWDAARPSWARVRRCMHMRCSCSRGASRNGPPAGSQGMPSTHGYTATHAASPERPQQCARPPRAPTRYRGTPDLAAGAAPAGAQAMRRA